LGIARELKSLADKALGLAEGAVEISTAAARTMTSDPTKKASIAKSGEFLRAAREAAGITTEELGVAIDLADPTIINEAEKGAAVALPFDLILRLAGVPGRNDPLAFAINVVRSHNPELWKSFDQFGFGKLVAQAGREREFANLYRANDAARRLSDEEFAHVLRFVGAAFDMAVDFHSQARTGRAS
jgi:transcriptional regulator with XRE-family HTH domain